MPELPEVETIRKQLDRVLLGKNIRQVDIRLPKQIKGIGPGPFKRKVDGSKILNTGRRAKMLTIGVKQGKDERHLVFHLKMTGQLIYHDIRGRLKGGGHPIKGALQQLPNKYSHIIFNFTDGSKLFFNDLRQFGWVTLVDSFDEVEGLSATPLGPEPLSGDFKLDAFIKCLKKSPKTRIYQALLGQKCVVGVGNIYANESLFVSGIRPARQIKGIKKEEFKRLYNAIIKILAKSVSERGTTMSDYMDALGDFGNFSKHLKVYQRQDQSCLRKNCGGKITRLKINGRSSFFCPKCQR